jgi:hypothetical protein
LSMAIPRLELELERILTSPAAAQEKTPRRTL